MRAVTWYGLGDVPDDAGPCVVTIGVFDGVHRGHRAVLSAAVAAGRRLRVPVLAMTFDPHPSEVVRPGSHPAVLTGVERRARLLHGLGIDRVLVVEFTPVLAALTAEDFARDVLARRLGAVAVVVGANFRFGHRASGDVVTLRELGADLGFAVEVVGLVETDVDTESSTGIRALVAAGDVEAAAVALGRPHRVEGVVVHGDHRGRALGFPTANLALPPHTAVPADGVYAGYLVRVPEGGADADEGRLPAAVSVGTNPTFDGTERRVEAYVLDRDDLDLYGEQVGVDFVTRLRPTLRFDSVDALVAQMSDDVDRARTLTRG